MTKIEWKAAPVPAPAATEDIQIKPFKLGDVIAEPNSVRDGIIRLGTHIDGSEVGMKFRVFHGKFQGPALVIQGGVHGDEYDGQESVRRIFSDLDTENLHGTVIAIPCVNESAFIPGTRVSGVDYANFNRIFPGSPSGSYSQRLADLYIKELIPYADAMVDIHTGGSFGKIAPLVIIQKGFEDLATALGLASNYGIIWKGGEWGGTARIAFLEAGKPAVTLEYGGGSYDQEVVEENVKTLQNILRYMGMIPGEAALLPEYTVVDATFDRAKSGGFYLATSEPGDDVKSGDSLARITDHLGNIEEEILAPSDGKVIWIRRRCSTQIGDETVIFGTVKGSIIPIT